MKTAIVVLLACVLGACSSLEPQARMDKTGKTSAITAYLKTDWTSNGVFYTEKTIQCIPDINIGVCPPQPKGITVRVGVFGLPNDVYQALLGQGNWLPEQAFMGNETPVLENLKLDLKGVDHKTLDLLNSSQVEVFPAQKSDDGGLWLFLTPQ
jgi:hypothetical protein